jgi:hypothetical protein
MERMYLIESSDGHVHLWDLRDGLSTAPVDLPSKMGLLSSARFSNCAIWFLAAGTNPRSVSKFCLRTRTLTTAFRWPGSRIFRFHVWEHIAVIETEDNSCGHVIPSVCVFRLSDLDPVTCQPTRVLARYISALNGEHLQWIVLSGLDESLLLDLETLRTRALPPAARIERLWGYWAVLSDEAHVRLYSLITGHEHVVADKKRGWLAMPEEHRVVLQCFEIRECSLLVPTGDGGHLH